MIRRPQRDFSRCGYVLLAVLVVVFVLALTSYHYSDWMQAENQAAFNARKLAQARAFAESGLHYAAAVLSDPEGIANQLNGNPFDNPDRFRDVAVAKEARLPGRFSLMAPSDSETPRCGLVDESAKINLNAIIKKDPSGKTLYNMLVKLPDMTEEIAASIADWIDADSDPRTNGAEDEHYSGLSPGYRCKNGLLDSLEELLLVRGVTPELLFGEDKNRNGIRDGDETGASQGWANYLTVYSREQNIDSGWQTRAYLNGDEVDTLYEQMSPTLGDDLAKFVILYRQYGPATSSGRSQSLGGSIFSLFGGKSKSSSQTVQGKLSDVTTEALFKKKASRKLKSMFELMDSQVSVPGVNSKSPATLYTSPLKELGSRRDLLPKLFEKATVFAESDIPARVNINTAPAEVLTCLPGLTDSDVQTILSQRPGPYADSASEIYDTLAWLSTEANLSVSKLRSLEPYVTTRTQVYRVQSLGYFEDRKGPRVRMEAVVDVNAGRPRFLLWRDLSELGVR